MTDRPTLRPIRLTLLTAAVVMLGACTDPPDLDDRVDPALQNADYPDLVPVEQILGTLPPDDAADAQTSDRLDARARNLQARARQLQRTSPIDDQTRARLNSDIATD